MVLENIVAEFKESLNGSNDATAKCIKTGFEAEIFPQTTLQ